MTSTYSLTSEIYALLHADTALNSISGTLPIEVTPQRRARLTYPVICMFVRSSLERKDCDRLSDVIVDIVIRDKRADEVDSNIAKIAVRVDDLLNEAHLTNTVMSATLTRRGIPVGIGLYDDQEQDYFKLLRYRAVLKTK